MRCNESLVSPSDRKSLGRTLFETDYSFGEMIERYPRMTWFRRLQILKSDAFPIASQDASKQLMYPWRSATAKPFAVTKAQGEKKVMGPQLKMKDGSGTDEAYKHRWKKSQEPVEEE